MQKSLYIDLKKLPLSKLIQQPESIISQFIQEICNNELSEHHITCNNFLRFKSIYK